MKQKERKRSGQRQRTLKDVMESKHSYCFFSVTTDSKDQDYEIIKLFEGEKKNHKDIVHYLYNVFKNNHKSVSLYDYGIGRHTYYNRFTGLTNNVDIGPKKTEPVDLKVLIAAINKVGRTYPGEELPPKFFSFVYKLLTDEVLGTGFKDLKGTTFRNQMKTVFSVGGDSSFYKFTPKGKYPDWYYDADQFTRDKNKRKEEALAFAEVFIAAYNDIKLEFSEDNKPKNTETAEESAE